MLDSLPSVAMVERVQMGINPGFHIQIFVVQLPIVKAIFSTRQSRSLDMLTAQGFSIHSLQNINNFTLQLLKTSH
ncbi:hypothetical protein SUGI_0793570 [Cryptomeria japonica]|nr:hypothetical protein SUGI_0793570 [Cryptomeria japonica]